MESLPHWEVERVFWCEKDRVAAKFIRGNWDCQLGLPDAGLPDFYEHAPKVDLFTAGFPCQPFSVAGLGNGLEDCRSQPLLACLAYIRRVRPRVAIMENVKGLVTRHGSLLIYILEQIKELTDASGNQDYSCFWKILDSRLYGGVPQHRERVWIVMIRRMGRNQVPFKWPPQTPAASLTSIFDRGSVRLRTYKRYPLPDKTTAKTKHARIIEALVKVQKYAEEKNVPAESVACIVDTLAAANTSCVCLRWLCFVVELVDNHYVCMCAFHALHARS